MVSQGRFGLPTFPFGGAKLRCLQKGGLRRGGCISALVSCSALASGFGLPLAMQGAVTPQYLKSAIK